MHAVTRGWVGKLYFCLLILFIMLRYGSYLAFPGPWSGMQWDSTSFSLVYAYHLETNQWLSIIYCLFLKP